MYSNTHVASALAAAALFILSAQNARAQSSGDYFSSSGSGPLTNRYSRYLKEPDLFFEWEKTPVPEDPFDPELLIRDRDLIPDPFPILTGDEHLVDSDDAFVQDTKRRVLYPADAPILQGWTNGTGTIPKGRRFKKGRRSSGYGYLILPSKIKLKQARASVDDYSSVPAGSGRDSFTSGGDAFSSQGFEGDTFSSHGCGYNVGSQTEQIVVSPEPPPKISSNIRPLRKTLHDIWDVESPFNDRAVPPTKAQRARLASLYLRAAEQEDNKVMSAYYRCRSYLMTKSTDKAFVELDKIYKLSPDNDTIFDDLADEFLYEDVTLESKIIRLYPTGLGGNPKMRVAATVGLKALERHDWIAAWQSFEQVFEMKPHPKLAQEIAHSYSEQGRDMETCIWCSRCLPIAEDWNTFDDMYFRRASIESRYYDEYLKKEPKITAHWPANKVPLKVYFKPEASDDADFYCLMIESLEDWMYVARGKLDYQIVYEEEKSDLIIGRPTSEIVDTRYDCFKGGNAPPTGVPRPPLLGVTYPEYDGLVMKKARIDMYDSMQAMPENQRTDVYLHELGHALGLIGHSKESKDIMYAYGRMSKEFLILDNHLSFGDVQRLKDGYKSVPLNQVAVEKYNGMKALCQRLADNPVVVPDSEELPDHMANLMPVLESTGFEQSKNTLDDTAGSPSSSSSSSHESSSSNSSSSTNNSSSSQPDSSFWSPSTHYVANFAAESNYRRWSAEQPVKEVFDPVSTYPVSTGPPVPPPHEFDYYGD